MARFQRWPARGLPGSDQIRSVAQVIRAQAATKLIAPVMVSSPVSRCRFKSSCAKGVRRHAYVDHVRAGVDLPSVWEQLQDQLYLGDAGFAEVLGEKIGIRLSADAEMPRLQRLATGPLRCHASTQPGHVQAYAMGLLQHERDCLGLYIHYATVSRVLKRDVEKV